MPPIVRVFPDANSVIAAAWDAVVQQTAQSVAGRGHAWVVLSGGDTPRALYERLAASPDALPLASLRWGFGDERWVPHHDPLSNFAMLDRVLFAAAPVPRDRIVGVPTDMADPATGARAYEAALRTHFPGAAWPEFDVVLMGLGADGHTASLFPGDRALAERRTWVTTTHAGKPVPDRVTLTVPVFTHSRCMIFLVTGSSKAEAVAATLAGPPDPTRWPAQAVMPESGECWWLIDEAAAANLPERYRRH